MKYQVGFIYNYEGEYSVEADSIEEAKELLKDLVFSDPFNDSDLNGSFTCEITEVYEWDEVAQERARKKIQETIREVIEEKEKTNG